jgi:pimeloyl-ACP methyl ester carboxylesterase
MDHAVRTSEGRTLAVQEAGDPAGRPVLVHMGTPNSRHLYGPNVEDAGQRGIRLLSYDRPGYGGSTPQPGRAVADCAADVRAICAALGIERLAMWGISGGGPHVLACAALLPDLVAAAASLASPAPYGADGLDYFAGMGDDNANDIRLLLTDKRAGRAKWEKDRHEILATSAGEVAESMKSLLAPADAAVLTGSLVDFLVLANRAGLSPGSQGWWDDSCALREQWGFDLADISVPVLLLHGRQDQFVPYAHGEWLAGHIPGAEVRLLDNDGHLTLVEHRVPEVHTWLLDHLNADGALI